MSTPNESMSVVVRRIILARAELGCPKLDATRPRYTDGWLRNAYKKGILCRWLAKLQVAVRSQK